MSEDHSRSARDGGSPFGALAPCPECGGALTEADHTDDDGPMWAYRCAACDWEAPNEERRLTVRAVAAEPWGRAVLGAVEAEVVSMSREATGERWFALASLAVWLRGVVS